VGFAELEGAPFGLVLTHDEKLLIVAAGTHVALLHVGRLLSGQGQPLVGMIRDSTFVGSIMVNVTADDRYVFVSQERTASIAVIDLANLKSAGSGAPAIVGSIPTGNAPISIELARDERYLYATSQTAPAAWGWPVLCPPQGNPKGAPDHRQGVVLVIDVARAKQNRDRRIANRRRRSGGAGDDPGRSVPAAAASDGGWSYAAADELRLRHAPDHRHVPGQAPARALTAATPTASGRIS
jgi:DNA-binding beta-propeller fold protein YncE